MKKLHLDIETYSPVDLKKSGVYPYAAHPEFEILMMAYAYEDDPVRIIDFANGETVPSDLMRMLFDPAVQKCAHNAAFERVCLSEWGYEIPVEQWYCTAVASSYSGLPLSLGDVSAALELGDMGKDSTGKALIRYFSIPCKPTKANGMRTRNLPEHAPDKWVSFKKYCMKDVEAERMVSKKTYPLPELEQRHYFLDQEINDRGVLIDLPLVQAALDIDSINSNLIKDRMAEISGLDNPNSSAQLSAWLDDKLDIEVDSVSKKAIPDLIDAAEDDPEVLELLGLRQQAAKSAIKKYVAMVNCISPIDARAHGLFQFYGAGRTGRWAGRLIQLQNLYRNSLSGSALDMARDTIASGDYDLASLMYADISDILAQLVRTAMVAKPGFVFAVSDFSAIEARVIAWLAGEEWRLELFTKGGDIYKQSYAQMAGMDVTKVTKEDRQKGKVAELACGYQGAVGALKQMGGEKMGLSEEEMSSIVRKWRAANPNIVALWKSLENTAKAAIARPGVEKVTGYVSFRHDGNALEMKLPSGRSLFYHKAKLVSDDRGFKIKYMGMEQMKKKWTWLDTYGGKLAENLTQAVARDILAEAMLRLADEGYQICMHVHDEVIAEVREEVAEAELKRMSRIMGEEVSWAKGLPLGAEGYVTPYYKKD